MVRRLSRDLQQEVARRLLALDLRAEAFDARKADLRAWVEDVV